MSNMQINQEKLSQELMAIGKRCATHIYEPVIAIEHCDTIFDFPPNEIRDVTVQVHQVGRGKLVAVSDLDDIEFIQSIVSLPE